MSPKTMKNTLNYEDGGQKIQNDTKNDTKNGTLTDDLQEVNNDAINTHNTKMTPKNDTKN